MKLQCLMKDSWKINHFPFDRQKLRLSIENSPYDSKSLVFVADTGGKQCDPCFTLSGWRIDSFDISTGIKAYETNFGDTSIKKPYTEYSSFRVRIGIERDTGELFLKMFLGMYVSFLISYICFYIHADNIDFRFSLSVGSLLQPLAINISLILHYPIPPRLPWLIHFMTLPYFLFSLLLRHLRAH